MSLTTHSTSPEIAPSSESGTGETAATLSPTQASIVDFFAHAATSLSLPKSVGSLFGLLYGATEPLCFDQIVTLLQISKGSASQGLRMLQNLNAVRTVFVTGDRRTFYEAEISLRRLVSGLLDQSVRPQLESSAQRLESILESLNGQPKDQSPEDRERNQVLTTRIQGLQSWHSKATRLLPWLARVTAPKRTQT